ncbi:MAG: 1-deoxy-D-xylulose-5-phosphate reductoisomerase [Candidatus Omnitrophota bacterium]|nr:1-deoxy-D-xylulose-5-phosphate reductoisomerase [Candidatus Omnitrophota bacterium]
MKRVAILGSTGSIGRNTLDVIRRNPGEFRVLAITANSDIDTLGLQAEIFKPAFIGVADAVCAEKLRSKRSAQCRKLFTGLDGLCRLAEQKEIDLLVLAISGAAALRPLLAAIEAAKDIALANKEALVMAGQVVMGLAARKKIRIIPIDSEQSAIWQCLEKEERCGLKYIYLTASGGPFWNKPAKFIKKCAPEAVLRHPRWNMGEKITVDSATMMNKGLELLEAMHLFGVGADQVKIIIHPEAVIHSMVEFRDGVVMAQMSATDMRIPIQYALSYPRRLSNTLPKLDFYKLHELRFVKPDLKKFPCLALAYRAAKALGTLPAVLNAANEVSVSEFLRRRICFGAIPRVIEIVMDRHCNRKNPELAHILEADQWARAEAEKYIAKKGIGVNK